MINEMRRRVDKIAQRMSVRRWEYRQRAYARGVWFRFRRVLVDAREAFVIDAPDVQRLIQSGFAEEPVGAQLEPPKRLVFAPREAILSLNSACPVAVRLSAEVLSANCLALVRFE